MGVFWYNSDSGRLGRSWTALSALCDSAAHEACNSTRGTRHGRAAPTKPHPPAQQHTRTTVTASSGQLSRHNHNHNHSPQPTTTTHSHNPTTHTTNRQPALHTMNAGSLARRKVTLEHKSVGALGGRGRARVGQRTTRVVARALRRASQLAPHCPQLARHLLGRLYAQNIFNRRGRPVGGRERQPAQTCARAGCGAT